MSNCFMNQMMSDKSAIYPSYYYVILFYFIPTFIKRHSFNINSTFDYFDILPQVILHPKLFSIHNSGPSFLRSNSLSLAV